MEAEISKKLNAFFSQGKTVNYKKNEILLRAGEPIYGIFFLKKGYVRQYVISEEGDEVTIHIYQPGAFFPSMLSIAKTPNRYYFEATTPVETYRRSPQEVIEFVKSDLDVLFDLTNRFANAVIGLSKRIESLTIGGSYSKVVSLLSYLANKFGEEKNNQTVINLPITHNEIAAWTGAKRETVSRQMEKLHKDGVIDLEKHLIVIKNKKKLLSELRRFQDADF